MAKRMFSITEEQYREYDDLMIGLCLHCGAERECTEPDAERYPCEECSKRAVYGTQQLLIMGRITFCEDGDN